LATHIAIIGLAVPFIPLLFAFLDKRREEQKSSDVSSDPSTQPQPQPQDQEGEGEKKMRTREEIQKEVIMKDGMVVMMMLLVMMAMGGAAGAVHRMSRRQVFQMRLLRNGRLLEIDCPDVVGRLVTHSFSPRSLVAKEEGEGVWRLAMRPLKVEDKHRQPFRLLRPATWNWHASRTYAEFRRKVDLQPKGVYQAAEVDPSCPSVPYASLSPYYHPEMADRAVDDDSLLQTSSLVFDLPQDKIPPQARRFLRKFFSDSPISDSDLLELLAALNINASSMVLYTGPSTPFSRAVHRP